MLDNLNFETVHSIRLPLNAREKVKAEGATVKPISTARKISTYRGAVGVSYRILDPLDVTFRYNIGLTKIWDAQDECA